MPRIVFMGSPDFALPALSTLAEKFQVVGVVTQPDRPSGRGRVLKSPPIKSLAVEVGLPVIQPEKLNLPGVMEQLRLWAPEVIIVAAFGQILRRDILTLPGMGCLNIHASLLPRWRGAAPIQAAILAGDSQTGITIIRMDPGVDTGAIISQNRLPIEPEDTAGSLSKKLSSLGADTLLATLPRYLSGDLQPKPQEESGATRAPMLKKENGRLDFTQSVEELERQVRAFNPWPGAFLDWDQGILKVHRAHKAEGQALIGQRLKFQGKPAIGAQGGLLVLDEVQAAGRKAMSGSAFLAGTKAWAE